MIPHNTSDPAHWRERAVHMRFLALTVQDEMAMLMKELADDYDKMADRAALRAAGIVPR